MANVAVSIDGPQNIHDQIRGKGTFAKTVRAVKITGAHDFNDYAVAMRNRIPLYALMDTKGAMRSDGLSYEEAAAEASKMAEATAALITEGESRFHSMSDTPLPDVSHVNLVPEELRGLVDDYVPF